MIKLVLSNLSVILLNKANFGFNPDILGSNVINIMILILGLFYLGRKYIIAILFERQQKVVEALEEAENRLTQAQNRLSEAQKQLNQTQIVINDIKQEAESSAQKVKESILAQGKEDISRLTRNSKITVSNTEIRIRKQIQEKIISLALKRVVVELRNQLNAEMQARIIDYNIARLGGKL
nr:ATP synthase CF0 B chain [Cavernulicola chilensis]